MAKPYGYSLRRRKLSHAWGNFEDDNRIVGFDDLHNLSSTSHDFTDQITPSVKDLEYYFNGTYDKNSYHFLEHARNSDPVTQVQALEQSPTSSSKITIKDSNISVDNSDETLFSVDKVNSLFRSNETLLQLRDTNRRISLLLGEDIAQNFLKVLKEHCGSATDRIANIFSDTLQMFLKRNIDHIKMATILLERVGIHSLVERFLSMVFNSIELMKPAVPKVLENKNNTTSLKNQIHTNQENGFCNVHVNSNGNINDAIDVAKSDNDDVVASFLNDVRETLGQKLYIVFLDEMTSMQSLFQRKKFSFVSKKSESVVSILADHNSLKLRFLKLFPMKALTQLQDKNDGEDESGQFISNLSKAINHSKNHSINNNTSTNVASSSSIPFKSSSPPTTVNENINYFENNMNTNPQVMYTRPPQNILSFPPHNTALMTHNYYDPRRYAHSSNPSMLGAHHPRGIPMYPPGHVPNNINVNVSKMSYNDARSTLASNHGAVDPLYMNASLLYHKASAALRNLPTHHMHPPHLSISGAMPMYTTHTHIQPPYTSHYAQHPRPSYNSNHNNAHSKGNSNTITSSPKNS